MTEVRGDIWALAHFLRDAIVIPTNVGWSPRGEAVMKLGLAGQASNRFPQLRALYGDHCQQHGEKILRVRLTGAKGGRWLILFPTKPLNEEKPYMSWQAKADLGLIERGLSQLKDEVPPMPPGKIYVPLLGCGRGALKRGPVRELMDQYLTADHFVRVRPLH